MASWRSSQGPTFSTQSLACSRNPGPLMHALAAVLAEIAGEGVGVGALEGGSRNPDRALGFADIGGAGVIGGVVSGLGDEAGEFPTGVAAGFAQELFEVGGVEIARERAAGVGLMGVGLALVPEEGAETTPAELVEAAGQVFVEGSIAFPLSVGEGGDVAGDCGRVGKTGSAREPFSDAGAARSDGDDSDRDAELFDHGIAERGHETAGSSSRAGLGIVGEPPVRAGKSGDEAGLGALLFLAVVGGIRLAGDDKQFADADMGDAVIWTSVAPS